MKFKIHNKLEIFSTDKKYIFFNKMLSSVYDKYSSLDSFSNFVLIGDGEPSSNQEEYKLTNQILALPLNTEIIQNDFSKGQLFVKKYFTIEANVLCGNYIKEIGITDNINSTTIYNYFSLIDTDFPNGILKESTKLYCTITLFLELNINDTNLTFLNGDNKFISFLLGEGLDKGITACSGDYYFCEDNSLMFYPDLNDKLSLVTTITKNETFEMSFDLKVENKILKSIYLLTSNTPFAVLKLQNYYDFTANSAKFSPKTHYVIDLGENIKSIKSITNINTNIKDTGVIANLYANEIGYEIKISAFNLFDGATPKFVSNDGKHIAFVRDNIIYLYQNLNYQITQMNTHNLTIQNIRTIEIIDNYFFVFSNIEPYVFCYLIYKNELRKINFDFEAFNDFNLLKDAIKYTVAKSENNIFMIGLICNESQNGYTLYFTLNDGKLVFTNYIVSNYEFSYVLAINKNNYCDAQIIYLQEGEYSYTSRIVTHYPDQTNKDVYSSLAYTLCKDAKEIYVKDRAIIVERTISPKIQIYHFPQVYEYLFPEIEDENDYYISNNLLYMAVKHHDNTTSFYNLVGYNEAFKFNNNLPEEYNSCIVENIIFLKDLLLVFTNNKSNKISIFTLKQNRTLLENLSSNTDDYLIEYDKYRFLGENNEGAIIKISMNITIWFFRIKFIKYVQVTM